MTWAYLAFALLSIGTLFAACMVLLSKHETHALWYLFLVGCGTTCLLATQHSLLLAVLHFVLIVIGSTTVILLLTQVIGFQPSPPGWPLSAICLPLFLLLGICCFHMKPPKAPNQASRSTQTKTTTIDALGSQRQVQKTTTFQSWQQFATSLFTQHFLAFGLLCILLIVAFASVLVMQRTMADNQTTKRDQTSSNVHS